MSELKDKNSIKENNEEQGAKERHWFSGVEKLFAVFATVICGSIALTIKNAEPLLTFVSRQPYINDMLHDHIFRDYLEIVNGYTPKVVPHLLLAVIVLFVASFIMDYKKSEHGYVLRIAGMFMASLTGLGYILVYVIFAFAEPVMNVKTYVFLSLVAIGFLFAIISCIFYRKKNAYVHGIVLKCITAVCVLGCFVGAGFYLAKNLGADYKVCYETNQLLKEHSNGINQDIAYQIGNVEKGEATWHEEVMYYTTGKAIWKIDGSGTVKKLYSMPGEGEFYAYGIYYYEDYLYVGCAGYSGEAPFSVLQVSVADGSAKVICSPTSNRKFFGVVDGKLLYTTATEEEYVADVYCIDLKGTIDEKEAVFYDKGVNALTGLDREIWLQKYLYGYVNDMYWPNDDYQFIGENGYYIYD